LPRPARSTKTRAPGTCFRKTRAANRVAVGQTGLRSYDRATRTADCAAHGEETEKPDQGRPLAVAGRGAGGGVVTSAT
jgi:hypothetical protein